MPPESNIAYFFDVAVASFHHHLVRPAHLHGATQLTISLDGVPHRVGPDAEGMVASLVHFVPAHRTHAYDGAGGEQVLLWLAPESRASRILGRRVGEGTALPGSELEPRILEQLQTAHRERWSATTLRPALQEAVDLLTAHRPPAAIHPAVRRAVGTVRALPIKKISADVLAAEVGLSKSRLLHLLKEHLGIPLRPYLAWLRCLDAIVLMSRGADATTAALTAGFTDGAHLNRVMKKRFGLSPSQLAHAAEIEVCIGELGR